MSEEQNAAEDVARPKNERMLTAHEVAERLGIHVSTVYRMGPRLDAQRLGQGKVRPRGFRVPESKVSELFPVRDAA